VNGDQELELRSINEDEYLAWHGAISLAFSDHPNPKLGEVWRKVTEIDRTIAVFDGGEIVANAGAFSFDLTVPGGSTLPAAGVTAVGVRHTHRRRGLLNRMMRHQLDDVVRRGEPLAVLTASETVIYGRYGYGLATQYWGWKVDTLDLQLAVPSRAGGRLRVIDKDAAAKVLPGIHDVARLRHPGQMAWLPAYWEMWLADLEQDRDGATARFYLLHENDGGEPDGYLAYNVKHKWSDGLPDHTVNIVALHAVDDEVEAALFEHLVTIDLVRHVSGWGRPVNDHLLHRLANTRRMRVNHAGDHLWLRVLDVPRALSARTLGADDRLVLSVTDGFMPASGGVFSVAPDGCTRADGATPDLALDARDLGAIYLGGVTPTTLGRAGRITELTPGALARADHLFFSSQTPWCDTDF
jgi:predicted acetyltransferase